MTTDPNVCFDNASLMTLAVAPINAKFFKPSPAQVNDKHQQANPL
jgi:hypothetical protein